MSRWFRHYAGMARDDKLVRAALRSKQPVERVVWIWSVILESAAEIDDGGRFELDVDGCSQFLDASAGDVLSVVGALESIGYVRSGCVVWQKFRAGEDRERADTHIWRRLRELVFRRDDFCCQYCGRRGQRLECDHVVPVCRGGTDALSNLVTACLRCNRSKGSKLVAEWAR